MAALRGITVVLDEYIKDHDAALETLERLSREGDLDSHHVNDRRACVYFSQANYAAAEKEWTIALERWPKDPSFDHGAAFAARSAGISAARQDKWEAAAKWFLEIPNRLDENETAFIASAYADAGFAWWKAGHADKAVDALIEAWRRADSLPLGKEDLRAFHTRKIISHVIGWLHEKVDGSGNDFTEPQPGMCSTAELPERIRELPESEPEAVWLLLVRVERALNAGTRAAELVGEGVKATTSAPIRAMYSLEKIARSLDNGQVYNLPAQVIEAVEMMQKAARLVPSDNFAINQFPLGGFGGNDGLIGAPLFLAALLSANVYDKSANDVIGAWRSCLATIPHLPE